MQRAGRRDGDGWRRRGAPMRWEAGDREPEARRVPLRNPPRADRFHLPPLPVRAPSLPPCVRPARSLSLPLSSLSPVLVL